MGNRNLLQLLARNRAAPRRFDVSANADEATVYLYDVIVSDELTAEWLGGVAPESFVKALNAITASTLHLRINSPGGDVFAARAIESAIRAHPARVVAHIDGYAASAASIVAVAADEIEIASGGFYMIHNAWTVAYGNANELMDTAAILEKVDGTLAETYAQRTKQPVATIREWMAAETWFTGAEAVANGFADRLYEAAPKASWDLAVYNHAPKAPAPAKADAPAPTASKSNHGHAERLFRVIEEKAA
jgi:ATP-dependent Clp protease protease subunit